MKRKINALCISNFKVVAGNWTEDGNKIKQESIQFFQNLLIHEDIQDAGDFLDSIPSLMTEDDNSRLEAVPSMEEIKEAVFSIPDKTVDGVDGSSGIFYKAC
ncbi:hypothetical protein ACH5RR_039314 [Cinchona calisaya]|uniref:Uncharacterized protein n=1 Tax=Cinchona calisaya TaxID=153742 RepID=A0ABD2XZP2_9GENT